jgi:hypothetical protein
MENIADKVRAIVMDSLFKDGEVQNNVPPADAVIVEGIRGKMGFHPGRLESHRAEIAAILREMPDAFHKNSGGGWSFLQLCLDKNDNHWGEHVSMDELCVLAIGLKLGEWCLPRNMWMMLPGHMPYVMFDVSQEPVN